MTTSGRTKSFCREDLVTYWKGLVLILALATLVGCQGVSGSSSSNQQPAPSGDLGLSHSSLNFGSVVVGSSNTLPVTATNSGTAAVTITGGTFSVPQFSLSGQTFPLTVSAGQSASLKIVFTPSSTGNVSGTISITSNASNGALSISLSGTGIAPGSLTMNPASVDFGSVAVGSSQQQAATLTNTGGASVTISQATASGTGFSLSGLTLPVTLAGGQGTSLTLTFAPQSAGSAAGSLTITSDAPNPTLDVPLSGTGTSSVGTSPGVLTANPTSLAFGSVQVGNSQTLTEVVTNSGGSNVTISQDTVTGSGFSVSGFTPPLTLTPGQNYTFSVLYAPQSSGNATGSISLASNASNSNLSISLSGAATAAGQLAINPASLTFSNVVVGTSANQTATLSASGSSVTVTSGNFTGSEFSLSGLSFPVTIQAGNNASFTVTFTPQSTGAANASLTFASNASNASATQSLTGTGTAPPVHSVVLSWTASSSSNITSYNVYRSTTSGNSYAQIGSVTAPTVTYTDTSSLTDGVTYYYVTTAVDSSNQESAYSNQTTAVIPPP